MWWIIGTNHLKKKGINMEEIVAHLDSKEHEISEYMKAASEEREVLRARLNEIDNGLREADADLRRISKARKAIRDDPNAPKDAGIIADGFTPVAKASVEAALSTYVPGSGQAAAAGMIGDAIKKDYR
jgi:SMC interacting uncharacterized protein involved in chromosome segregation